MRSIDHVVKVNRWSNDYISPGPVGPVGDVNMTPRLRSSATYLPPRYDSTWSGKKEITLGANVSDGQERGYSSGGGPAAVYDAFWGGGRQFRNNIGWRVEDVVVGDVNIEPFLQSDGGCAWNRKVGQVYEGLRTGDKFLPVPGPFRPADGELQRFPTVRVTDIIGGDDLPSPGIVGRQNSLPYGSSLRSSIRQ
jgi:hypothetical protein